jgi:3',5'-cyclic AMP phosphodiesterase CpdA
MIAMDRNDTMVIAQLTDLHIVPQGERCQGQVDTTANLEQVVARLKALRPAPDAVLITGDLVERGSIGEYRLLRGLLDQLPMPYYLVPGNHDRRAHLLQVFADHDHLPPAGAEHVLYAIEDYPVRLIGLDTALTGEPHGRLCATRLDWLDRTLAERPDVPTLIFMHHPPFATGIRWIDAAGLYGGREMEAIVARHPQVQRVLCGHAHRPIQLLWGGAIASVAASSCHAQLALTLTDDDGYDMRYTLEPAAMPLLTWEPRFGLVGHTFYLDLQAASYVPDYAADAAPAFRMAYRRFHDTEYQSKP